jgi:uncharacterized protein (TIGR02001 family)
MEFSGFFRTNIWSQKKIMKFMKFSVACGAVLVGVSSLAQAEISANIAVTSNYVWRGVTQTDDGAAVQGGIDWAHESGFYLGTWASNVEFKSDVEVVGPGADGMPGTADDTVDIVSTGSGEVEWDLYGGYANEFGDFSYDVGYLYYAYPDTKNADFGEIYGNLGWKWLSGGLNYTVNSDVDGPGVFQTGDLFGYLNLSFDLPMDFSIGGTVGRYWFDDDGRRVDGDKLDLSYTYFQLDVGKSAGDWGDFTMSFTQAEDTEATGFDDDWKVFVSWAKTFE